MKSNINTRNKNLTQLSFRNFILPAVLMCIGSVAMSQQVSYAIEKNNPLKKFLLHGESHPFFIDIDGDNDLDCFAGEYNNGQFSKIYFYRNDGNEKNPVFKLITGAGNPLNNIIANTASIPYFVDIDNDGDYDCFIGDGATGAIMFYENVGNKKQAQFVKQSAAYNPLSMVKFFASGVANPVFADVDGDGYYDCLVTDQDGNETYFKNTGTAKKPSFVFVASSSDPFNFLQSKGGIYNVSLTDWNKDGLVDLFVNGTYYKNTGTKSRPKFEEDKYNAPVFENISVSKYAYTPLRWVDLNNDGVSEVFQGNDRGAFVCQTISSVDNAALKTVVSFKNFQVFPNPSKNEFILNIPSDKSVNAIIRVTDLQGKVFLMQDINSNTTKLGKELKPGVYFIQVMQNNEISFSQKVIKE